VAISGVVKVKPRESRCSFGYRNGRLHVHAGMERVVLLLVVRQMLLQNLADSVKATEHCRKNDL